MTDEQKELEREKYLTFIYVKVRNSRGQLLKQTQANTSLIEDAHMPLELFLDGDSDEGDRHSDLIVISVPGST